MNRTTLTIVGGVTAVGALLALLFFSAYERIEETTRRGPNGVALVNPYLAAEWMLDELGRDTRSTYGIPGLPPHDRALLLMHTEDALQAVTTDELWEWVDAGGHLMFTVDGATTTSTYYYDDRSVDGLLQTFGLGATAPPTGAYSTSDGEDVAATVWTPRGPLALWLVPTALPTAGYNGTCWEYTDGDATVQHTRLGGDQYCWAVTAPYGLGEVTAFASADVFRNDLIGEAEHAALLWSLANASTRQEVTMVVDAGAPSLWALLWRHARELSLSVLILILVVLWYATGRFGPVLRRPAPTRRSLMEHVTASGHVQWSASQDRALLESARQDLRRLLARRLPGLSELDAQAQSHRIAEASGLPYARISRALHAPATNDPMGFIDRIADIQALRAWANASSTPPPGSTRG